MKRDRKKQEQSRTGKHTTVHSTLAHARTKTNATSTSTKKRHRDADDKQQHAATSRPKARHGHRYPCPALVFFDGGCYVSRAAAPEGTGGDEVL